MTGRKIHFKYNIGDRVKVVGEHRRGENGHVCGFRYRDRGVGSPLIFYDVDFGRDEQFFYETNLTPYDEAATKEKKVFAADVCDLINRHGYDTVCNVPDFILADYVVATLSALTNAHNRTKERGKVPGVNMALENNKDE